MDECIDLLEIATIPCATDCNSGYWQIEVLGADHDGTTFFSHNGLICFILMSFGLETELASFQRAAKIILSKVKWQFARVYLDDIKVYSEYVRKPLVYVGTAVTLLKNPGVALSLLKGLFFGDRVSYLENKIRPGKLAGDRENCDAARKSFSPTNQAKLRLFSGV